MGHVRAVNQKARRIDAETMAPAEGDVVALQGPGGGPLQRLDRPFAGFDLGDADVEFTDERRPVFAGVKGGAADDCGDPLGRSACGVLVGGGQGQGEDLRRQAGGGVLDADKAADHRADLGYGAV